MPRTRSLAWSELKIGVLTVGAVTIAAVLIFSLTGTKGFAWQRYSLKTKFTNVAGLASGSPVRIAGVEVGTVTAVELTGEDVDVTFQVNEKNRPLITDRSVAKLGSVSLLGQSAVDITPNAAGTPIPDWGYVPQGKPAAAMSDMTDSASQGITELTAMLHDIRGVAGVEFGAGAYEKVRVGKNFLAIVDAKISGNGNETFVRVRAGLAYRQKSFYAIAILPQFVQRNYNEYNTPLGAEAGLDRKLLMLSLSADFYNDRPVFYFRARIQIRA